MSNLNQNERIKCPNRGSFTDTSTALYIQILSKAKQGILKQKKEFEDEANTKRAGYTKAFNDLKT